MGAFKIEIIGVGGHGCERKSKAGERLFGRCGRFNCPDCMAYEFVQQLRQKGMVRDGDGAYSVQVAPEDVDRLRAEGHTVTEEMEYGKDDKGNWVPTKGAGRFHRQVSQSATFTHWPEQPSTVVDDMLKNERTSGSF